MIADRTKLNPGALFERHAESVLLKPAAPEEKKERAEAGSHPLAFAGLFVFTLLLYVRPNELFPDIFGTFPIMKIVAILTLIVYIGGKLGHGERLSTWPLEMSMLAVIILLGIILTPISAAPSASIDLLTDTFFKVTVIFVLMINLVDTQRRLRLIMKLVVICGTGISAGSIAKFAEGKFTATVQGVGVRIEGTVGGIFGNPNDLAMALDLLLPLAIVLAFTSNSAQERQGEMKQALDIALRHPFIGIGMGNYPFYSNHAIRAHNAYVEVAGELGIAGLIAYMVLIFAPLRSLKRIERETSGKSEPRKRELHLLSAGVHAAIMSYVVCAVFSSAQYQWYLFYVVGYALSLRKLHATEKADKVEAVAIEPVRADEDGILWRGEAVRG